MNPEAWEILNLDPSATIEQVRKRFRKLALKYHPDKGGSPFIFDKLKQAYKDILTFHSGLNQKDHHELRQQYNQVHSQQTRETYRGILDPKNLNIDRFNSFFVQHRLEDPLDNGYGHLMEKSSITREEDSQVSKTKIKHFADQQLILYQEPQEVFNCTSNVGILGADNKNFTTAWNQKTKYTDYIEAHSKPVDRNIIPLRDEYKSVDELKVIREKSLKATKEEEKRLAKIMKKKEKEERERMKRLSKQEHRMKENYQKIQNLLGYK